MSDLSGDTARNEVLDNEMRCKLKYDNSEEYQAINKLIHRHGITLVMDHPKRGFIVANIPNQHLVKFEAICNVVPDHAYDLE